MHASFLTGRTASYIASGALSDSNLVVCMHVLLQVGSVNNTFGIKGVEQYCNFFKSIEDANRFR
jgi:NADH:ubiquinone reductase (non-electrogenic)